MALYRYEKFLQSSKPNDAWETLYTPGTKAPHSGIYRCEGCGDEIAANAGNPLPPQNHHQHTKEQGTIRWRLIVFPVQKK